LTQNIVVSGGNQFYSNYRALMSALVGAENQFELYVGQEIATAWQRHVHDDLDPSIPLHALPMIFRNWAVRHGYITVANKGASALAALVLDPIPNAQLQLMLYTDEHDAPKPPDWIPNYKGLEGMLSTAPQRKLTFNSKITSTDTSKSWTKSYHSGFFGLWGGSSPETTTSTKFASSEVSVDAEFKHVLELQATPGAWYSSAAMGLAYSHRSGKPWDEENPIQWNTTFDPQHGNMARFAANLVVVDTMRVEVKSNANFSQEDQADVQRYVVEGLWPFYCGSSRSGSNTDVKFDDESHMTVTSNSQPGVPIVIGLTVLPVDECVGHAVEGLQMVGTLAA
jgi:hypothetical protein